MQVNNQINLGLFEKAQINIVKKFYFLEKILILGFLHVPRTFYYFNKTIIILERLTSVVLFFFLRFSWFRINRSDNSIFGYFVIFDLINDPNTKITTDIEQIL